MQNFVRKLRNEIQDRSQNFGENSIVLLLSYIDLNCNTVISNNVYFAYNFCAILSIRFQD